MKNNHQLINKEFIIHQMLLKKLVFLQDHKDLLHQIYKKAVKIKFKNVLSGTMKLAIWKKKKAMMDNIQIKHF